MPKCFANGCLENGTFILSLNTTTFWCLQHVPDYLARGHGSLNKQVEADRILCELRGANVLETVVIHD